MGLKDDFKNELLSFSNALNRLQESLAQPKDQFVRDSVVQRFEFSFELAWKVLKLYLEFLGRGQYNSPRECILAGAQVGVIDNSAKWLDYLRDRNISTHAYSEDLADQVYESAAEFVHDGLDLLKLLEEKFKESEA